MYHIGLTSTNRLINILSAQNDCLQNIISDMENAMLKISVDGKTHQNHQFDREMNDKEEPTTDIQSAATNNTHEKVG